MLEQNYPNPFNPLTTIKFEIPNDSYTELKVYDVLGREISILVNDYLKHGTYEVEWNASEHPSGTYFYRIAIHSDKKSAVSGTNNYSETKRMVLVK
jgi:hypothetical protein